MNDATRGECEALLASRASGALSAEVTLTRMLIATERAADVRAFLERTAGPVAAELAALLDAHAAGAARIGDMLAADVDVPPEPGDVDAGLAYARRLFDWSVQQSEEASVALHSLGSPALLARATAEIVVQLRAWGAVGPDRDTLEIGCGIGRMQAALAPHVREAWGVDVSPRMIEVARRRCASMPNVHLAQTEGRDLSAFADARFDLVLAVDSFPYLVQAGLPLVTTHVREAARVLRPGGALVVLAFSYREDDARDVREVTELGLAAGLTPIELGTRPFTLWNGAAFRLRRT